MTGRELIVYILQNHLEDKPVLEDGKFVGFLSVDDAAVKFNVGPSTVKTWIALGLMTGVKVGDVIYIPDIPRNYAQLTIICE